MEQQGQQHEQPDDIGGLRMEHPEQNINLNRSRILVSCRAFSSMKEYWAFGGGRKNRLRQGACVIRARTSFGGGSSSGGCDGVLWRRRRSIDAKRRRSNSRTI